MDYNQDDITKQRAKFYGKKHFKDKYFILFNRFLYFLKILYFLTEAKEESKDGSNYIQKAKSGSNNRINETTLEIENDKDITDR